MFHRKRDLSVAVVFISINILGLLLLCQKKSGTMRNPEQVNTGVVGDSDTCPTDATYDVTPRLTLFTTIKDLNYRTNIHLNTIKNWARLRPRLQPVLFVDDVDSDLANKTSWGRRALDHGWQVVQYPNTTDTIPVLKTMVLHLLRHGLTTPFVGFANADILLDDHLLSTLDAVVAATNPTDTVFVSGRRRNVPEALSPPDVYCPRRVTELGRTYPLYVDKSADYFIFPSSGFPWERVPDFVIGRIGYDTWLLSLANLPGFLHVDASQTVTAVHQTGPDGDTAGETINADPLVNLRLYPPEVRLPPGKHKCAPYESMFHGDGPVVIKRDRRPGKCFPAKTPTGRRLL